MIQIRNIRRSAIKQGVQKKQIHIFNSTSDDVTDQLHAPVSLLHKTESQEPTGEENEWTPETFHWGEAKSSQRYQE